MDPSKRPGTTVFHGGEIVTLNPETPVAEAMAVRDGRIVALGKLAELAESIEGAARIDLAGRCLISSLKDHHLHLTAVGHALLNRQEDGRLFVDLSGLASVEEIADRLAREAAALPPGTWILGMGWNQHDWGTAELPTHHELSMAVPNHPVFLVRVDAHAAWINAAAMEIAGMSRRSRDPHGGAILRLEDGEPSGVLLERAVEAVLARLAEPSDEDIRRSFRLATEKLAEQGVTDVFDAGFMAPPAMVSMEVDFERYFRLLCAEDENEPLPVRVNLMVPAPSPFADLLISAQEEYASPSPRIRVTHIKLYADGAFGSRGAALSHRYADDEGTGGLMRMTPQEIEQETRRAIAAGYDVATHAIGDLAVRLVLDAYQAVSTAHPDVSPRRFRIEHFGYASKMDLRRGARSGFVLVAQPNFILPDDNGIAMEDWRMGSRNVGRVYAWRTLTDLGAVLAGSSDYYVAPGPPLLDFYVAHTRKNPNGRPPGGWQPGQCLSRTQSLRLATTLIPPGGERRRGGMLREGDAADLTILSANPLEVAEDQILEIRALATFLEGEPTFCAPGSESLLP